MSSRQRNGSVPKSKKTVATPAKSQARKGSKRPVSAPIKFEQKKPSQLKKVTVQIPSKAPKGVVETVSRYYNMATQAHAAAKAVPVLGAAYAAGTSVLGRKTKDYISGLLGLGGSKGSKTVALPQAFGSRTSNFSSLRTGRASPHGDFPEGGIRISGHLLNNSSDALTIFSNSTYVTSGVFGSTLAHNNANALCGVSPTAYLSSNYSAFNLANMFGNGSNAVSSAAQFYRFFRFRRLGILMEGELGGGATNTGSVQFSYDRDINSMYYNYVSVGSTQAIMSTGTTTRVPLWTPRDETIWLINDMKTSLGDKLFSLTSANLGISSADSNADMLQYFQGCVAGITDAAQASAGVTFARFRWVFDLDLYGFNPSVADASVTLFSIPDGSDEDERYALATAFERIHARRQQEIEDEIKRQLLEIYKERDSALEERHAQRASVDSKNLKSTDSRLLKDSSSRQTSLCDSTTGCGQLDCKNCWSRATCSEISLAVKSTLEETKLDDVKLTDTPPSLAIPALVKPVELNRPKSKSSILLEPNVQKTLSEWEATISSLRKRYVDIVGEQKRRSAAVLDGLQYVLQPGDRSDAELEGLRVGLAEELRIVREELRRWRNENGLKP